MKVKTELKNLNKMAYPILLNYFVLSIFELLDKAIVGQYSIQGFAVVGIAAAPIYAITGALGILSAAFNLIAANEAGKKDFDTFEKTFVVSKCMAFLLGVLFLILSLVGGHIFFEKIYQLKGDTLAELLTYFYPAAITVVQNMLLFQYSAYYRNKLNTKISLYSTITSTVVNLFFDGSLVYGLCGLPRLGTAGAAWGSVIGLAAGLLVYQIPYHHRKKYVLLEAKQLQKFLPEQFQRDHIKIERAQLQDTTKRILKLYPSLFGQEFLESTLFVLVVSGAVARLGTEQMAVYGLLDTVVQTIGLPVFAYATATQTYALQEKAAGKIDQVKKYLMVGQLMTVAMTITVSLLYFPWRHQLLGLIVSNQTVIRTAEKILLFTIVVILMKIPYQFYMSYLQGIGKEKFVFLCTTMATIVASIGVVIFANVMKLPGIYLVMIVEYLILALVYWCHRT